MASSEEAETGSFSPNRQQAVPIRTAFTKMGHPQAATLIKTDSVTSYGILNGNMCRKRSKDFDMRFHRMHCRIKPNQLRLYWQMGTENLANDFTKHFLPEHHQRIRYINLQRANSQISCQRKTKVLGCVPSTASHDIIHSHITTQARPL